MDEAALARLVAQKLAEARNEHESRRRSRLYDSE
jgi:hypothetical protein